jgi:hypothetical protein
MRRFAKFFVLPLFACLLPGQISAGDKKSDAAAKGTPPKFDVPIPIGHDAQVVKLPYYNSDGKLQMNFSINLAKRVDANHLQMSSVKIVTYKEDGAKDMSIALATSVLDLNTRILTSKEPVTVERSDFVLTGDRMRFNTQTHDGIFYGHVRMLIFNRETMTSPSQETAQ